MTLKSDPRFKEQLTCDFKYDMMNFMNFHPTTQKSRNLTLMGHFWPKYIKFELKKIQRTYLSWHWTVIKNLNKAWHCNFKNGMRKWVNFHLSTQKSEKLYNDELLFSKGYNVSVRQFQRNNVSWHCRVMQNLKENWFVAYYIKNLVNFHANSRKSGNLLSWHWRVMQSLKKNLLLVPKMT